jgi:hypothetical protein
LIAVLAVLVQSGGEFAFMTRTEFAQLLRQSAWQQALAGLPDQTPWPWADEVPSGAPSTVPQLGLSASVSTDATSDPGQTFLIEPVKRVSAEDPHLPPRVLNHISVGDRITVTGADGSSQVYRVTCGEVSDPHLAEGEPGDADDARPLASCPRLDRALAAKLKLVIEATRAEPEQPSPLGPEQKL